MSDDLSDTPALGRVVCLGCEPDADPTREILDSRSCEQHGARAGLDDGSVGGGMMLSGGAESDGATCRAFAELLARPR